MSKTNTSKTETDNKASEPRSSFDPFASVQPMIADGLDRIQALFDELAIVERTAYDRAKLMSDQLGTMVSDSIEYAASLAREWRQISLEATRRSAQVLREKAA